MSGSTGRSTIAGPIERAFLLLQAVAASDDPVGIRELGRRTGLPRSTVSRLVATLVDLGMASRTSDGEVVAGAGVASLQPRRGPLHASLEDRLRPLLFDLVERFGESAALTIDTPAGAHYLSQVPGHGAVHVPDATGKSFAFHTVAPGMVLMAAWGDARLDGYLSHPLESPTDVTVSDPAHLRALVDEVASTGIAWADQALDLEVTGLAVPVIDDRGTVVAAISLYGPAYRLNAADRPDLASDLRHVVDDRLAILLA